VLHRIIRSWYTGRWWVGCYIWYSEEGPGGCGPAQSPPRCTKCNSPPSGLILSVQSKMQFVQSKMRNCAVKKHKVEDIIVQLNHLLK